MLTFFILGLFSFIIYVKWRHSYWKRRDVPQIEPDFLIGNTKSVLTGRQSLAEMFAERYIKIKSLNKGYAGAYIFLKPSLHVIDPFFIRLIIQKDFSHFMNHGMFHHHKDILSMHLFNLEGEVWKNLRAKLTPTFTSGKIKMMFDILREKSLGLEKIVGKYAEEQEPFAIKDVLGRFTTDIIGSCAFGIECNSLEDPENEFRKYSKKIFELSLFRFWPPALLPWWFLGYIGFKSNGRDTSDFFTTIVKNTIQFREQNQIHRKDFMQLLIELKNQKDLANSKLHEETNVKVTHTMSEDEIAAQCFVFFLAGFETSSTTMTFALLELAQNNDIQEKLRQEITSVLKKYDGQVTYEAVMEMHYLEKVINESLRKFPPVPTIPRICNKDYQIPGTNTIIEKGTRVSIPIWGLHRDPEYYPDPERFDPERFNEENKAKRPDFTFLPFGEGPRMCIGLRFGMLESKVGILSLIRNFKFTLNKKTPVPIKIARDSLITSVKGEVWLDAIKI